MVFALLFVICFTIIGLAFIVMVTKYRNVFHQQVRSRISGVIFLAILLFIVTIVRASVPASPTDLNQETA